LIVPIVGMMHVVLLPIAVVLLLSALQEDHPKLHRLAVYGIALLYALGIIGFIWGLSSPELYGKHMTYSEYAYKVAAPIYIILLSLPLCLDRQRKVKPDQDRLYKDGGSPADKDLKHPAHDSE